MESDKWIIFDFDSTLADTLEAWVWAINFYAEEFNYKAVNPEDAIRLRNLDITSILNEVGISIWKLPFIAKKTRAKFHERLPSQKFFPGIPEILQQLKSQGVKMGIVTSNSKENIEEFLKNNHTEIFDFIHSENSWLGKANILKKLVKKYSLDLKTTAYVGDQTRDVEAAKKAGLVSIAVTWGVNTRQALEAFNPDFVVDDPVRLLSAITSLAKNNKL